VFSSSEKVATLPIWLLSENALLIVCYQEADCLMHYKIMELHGVAAFLWLSPFSQHQLSQIPEGWR
jgi:hypothetical protein